MSYTVQFKTWEEMEKEYGLQGNGYINCEFHFTEFMRPLCGKVFHNVTINRSKVYIEKINALISTDMIHILPISQEKIE